MLPQEIFKFGVSEMPFPFFSTGFFSVNKYKRNETVSCLFYPSLALWNKTLCERIFGRGRTTGMIL